MRRFLTTPFDWFNYIAQNYNSNALIQFRLDFKSSIRFDLLKQAVRYCMETETLLGCSFKESEKPEWIDTIFDLSEICRHIESQNLEEEVDHFLAEKIDAGKECPIKLALLSHCSGTTLILKIHHALCDAGGALLFVQLLADTYSALELDSNFKPHQVTSKRGTEDFYKYFEVTDKEARFNPSILSDMQSTWGTPFSNTADNLTFAYQTLRFSEPEFLHIKEFAKNNDSSLNAVITAAYHRALAEILKPKEDCKEVQFSANLRPYSNDIKSYTICNFSNMFNVQLPTNGSFEELAKSAKKSIDEVLEPEKILQSVLACEIMSTDFQALNSFYADDWKNIKKSGLCTPMISNVGRLDVRPIYFGAQQPADMYIVSPAFIGPSFMLSVSTYNNVLTFCSAYQKPSTSDEFVGLLLKKIDSILRI